MSDKKNIKGHKKLKAKMTALILLIFLIVIIIFALFLILSRQNDDADIKGDSSVSSELTTTVSDDISTVPVTTMDTVKISDSESSSEISSSQAVTTVSSISESAVPTASVKNNSPQNVPVTQPASVKVVTSANIPAVTRTVTSANSSSSGVKKVLSIKLDFYECELAVGETKMPLVTMLPATADLTEKWESSDESVAVVDDYGNITAVSSGKCTVKVSSVNNPAIYAEVKVTVGDGISSSSEPVTSSASEETTDSEPGEPTYIQGILIANKTYALPSDYNPGLDSETESAFNTLSAAAAEEGLDIWLASGFRSYDTQDRIYNNYVSDYGQETADTFSARPGHSEHQTGLAIDVNTIDDSFAGTPEAIWLENHAHEYGFIIRYPKGKEDITGYKYEPWHIRYLGIEKATEVYNSGLTLEEFLGIDSVYQVG